MYCIYTYIGMTVYPVETASVQKGCSASSVIREMPIQIRMSEHSMPSEWRTLESRAFVWDGEQLERSFSLV